MRDATEQETPSPVVAAAGSQDQPRSSIVPPPVTSSRDGSAQAASGGIEALPTPPTAHPPDNPTRTATPTSSPELQPSVHTTALRSPERYHILGEHGRGGIGRVSRARDRELDREVAIKELISRGRLAEARFLREALITARLEHPGIVPIHEAGRWPDGTPFYAMKLVAGRPLRDLIAERKSIDQRLGLLHHVIAVADAIAYAHGRNIIHRDLKPANVIVGDFGETIVIDWGLAKDLSATDEPPVDGPPFRIHHDRDLTVAGVVLGTPTYMAPEQERGEHVDQRADVFAIGAMLWELCSLHKVPPTNVRQRHRLLHRAGIDKDLAVIIDKALDPFPNRRYPDAGALAADLKAFKSGARIAARRYSLLGVFEHWTRRHRALAFSVAAALVLVAVGAVLYVRTIAAERDRTDAALANTEAAKDDLTLEHAELLLQSDPTAAFASLSGYRGNDTLRHRRLLAEARGLGVATRTFAPHSDTIWFLRGDKTGAVFSVGEDGLIQLTRGNNVTTIAKDVSTNVRLAYAPTRELLAYATARPGVSLLNLRTSAISRITDVASRSLTFAPDGRSLAALDTHGNLSVWSLQESDSTQILRRSMPGAILARFMTPTNIIVQDNNAIHVFSIDAGDTATAIARISNSSCLAATFAAIAVGSSDGDVKLFPPSLNGSTTIHLCHERVTALGFIPGTTKLAFACKEGYSGVVRYADNLSNIEIVDTFPTHGSPNVTADPEGHYVAATDESNTVYVYDIETRVVHRYDGSAGSPTYIGFPNQEFPQVLVGDANGALRIWDAPSRSTSVVLQAPAPVFGLVFAADSDVLLTNGRENIARYLHVHDRSVAELQGHTAGILGAAISPDGTSLLTYGYDRTIRVWRTSDLSLLRTFKDHDSFVEEADFRDSEHIVSIGDDGRLMEWSPGGSDKIVLFTHTSALFRLEVLPTGRRIAVVDTAGSVWVVSPSGDVKQIRAANGDTATALKASSDGRLLAIGTGQGTIIVYDTITWQVVATLNSGGGVRQIQFDPLGRDLLIAFEAGRSFVGHVHLLPLNSRRSYRWSDVPAKVRAVAYAPDGETIAFVCTDGSTWLYSMRDDLWSYENNHRIDTLIVRFSPDGRLLATGDRRGAVVVRNLNLMFPANQR